MNYKDLIDNFDSLPQERKYRCVPFDLRMLENKMAQCKNPLLVVTKSAKISFMDACGQFVRNRYAWKPKLGKYDLYGESVDTEILDVLRFDEYAIVIDRDDEEDYFIMKCW